MQADSRSAHLDARDLGKEVIEVLVSAVLRNCAGLHIVPRGLSDLIAGLCQQGGVSQREETRMRAVAQESQPSRASKGGRLLVIDKRSPRQRPLQER